MAMLRHTLHHSSIDLYHSIMKTELFYLIKYILSIMNNKTLSRTIMYATFCIFKQTKYSLQILIDHQSASFIYFDTISTSSSNAYPWTVTFSKVFTLISIS